MTPSIDEVSKSFGLFSPCQQGSSTRLVGNEFRSIHHQIEKLAALEKKNADAIRAFSGFGSADWFGPGSGSRSGSTIKGPDYHSAQRSYIDHAGPWVVNGDIRLNMIRDQQTKL